ncbi:pyridoxamine 5'-phosphate oxidase [Halovulum dunhuangense]|uniref:Pyridoxamine 5'-phosphate oxidase n=1 Tax=Halovulum dunhuangense TaxID=1505036 RepID=A0A849L6P8_9RHOB|nr:pyridoxamine 5'-phosphate oxidase [Halovulum dunhuangense]
MHDRRAPARHPTLATVSADGVPQARTVVLRGADRAAARLRIHTDLRSAKMRDLRARPLAALHVWDSAAHLQIRLTASVSILTGDAVADLWARIPEAARLSYGGTPAPGQALADALAYEKTPDPAAFAVLQLDLQAMDILHLGPRHRRATYTRTAGWAGQWCAP